MKLPRSPKRGQSFWLGGQNGRHGHTHHLFRFPAKFHPPVVRWALGAFARKGSLILDPFAGSGTVQLEALLRGIPSVGIDIDPLACLLARAKTTPLEVRKLCKAWEQIEREIPRHSRGHDKQENRRGADISKDTYQRELDGLFVPAIPNITHWFRKYVIIDLATILCAINTADISGTERQFFKACFAAVIRKVSNADPTPVSGLEVTHVQEERNRRRKINVFSAFSNTVNWGIAGVGELWETLRANGNRPYVRIVRSDVLKLQNTLQASPEISLVITSPPYCQAVEYSRRHRLEMFWLGLVDDSDEHSSLAHSYIGRHLVRVKDSSRSTEFGVRRLDGVLRSVGQLNATRARTLGNYFDSMQKSFAQLHCVVRKNGNVVCVVGDSRCCGIPIPTSDLIVSLVGEQFSLQNRFAYAVRNHYMQYGLRNGDGIREENVLVFRRR
jgi:DNA methylase